MRPELQNLITSGSLLDQIIMSVESPPLFPTIRKIPMIYSASMLPGHIEGLVGISLYQIQKYFDNRNLIVNVDNIKIDNEYKKVYLEITITGGFEKLFNQAYIDIPQCLSTSTYHKIDETTKSCYSHKFYFESWNIPEELINYFSFTNINGL